MTGRRRLGLVAAGATLLASAPIATIFESWTWLLDCIFAVGLIAGAALLARTFRFPVWAQLLSMVGALLVTLTWMFPSGHEILIPQPATFTHFGELFTQAGQDTRSYGVPVPDRPGLLFVTVLGIGLVAILVDLLTVIMRRPALAGLPMLAIYSVPVAVYVDSVPVLPFIVGSVGYLWLLVSDNIDRVRRFGRRFTGDGRDVDVWEPSPLAAAGRRLGVVGVAAAVLLPVLVPTMTGGLLSQLTQSGSGVGEGGLGNGSGGRISLFAALSGQLNQTSTVTQVRLTTTEQDPFYLRFGVADQLNEDGFSTRTPTGQPLSHGLAVPEQNSLGNYQTYHATVQITNNLLQSWAPVYSDTVKISGLDTAAWSYDPGQQVVFSGRTTTKGKKYSFDYVRATYTPQDLETAAPLPKNDPIQKAYTSAPADTTVDSLVQRLTKDKVTPYDKVRALYDFFSKDNGFTYSLSTQPTTGSSTQIAAFLTNKAGFCQQYAAALAWMVRDSGIPARVAFGYTRGSGSGGTYELTNRNAHAWTEVYLQGFGWIPFDATPTSGVTGSARTQWAPNVDASTPAATSSTGSPLSGGNPSTSTSRATRPDPGLNDQSAGSAGGGTTGGLSTTALVISGLAALLIALLLVPALRRVLLRRHRHAATVPRVVKVSTGAGPPGADRDILVTTEALRAREDAHSAWDELIDTMIDFRVPVDPTETPRVTAQRLVREAVLLEEPATAAALLGTAEERARYARQPMQGAELTAALTRVRKGLARSATRRTRLAATLLPPSVLLRWRLSLADVSATTVGYGGRVREFLSRFNLRRLLAGRSR